MWPQNCPMGRGRGRGSRVGIMNANHGQMRAPGQGPPDENSNANSKSNRLQELNIHPNIIAVDLELDDDTAAWFTQLKKFWSLLKKSPTVSNMIHQHFEACGNPYEQALRLTYNCLDFKDAKPKTLAYLIMEEFGMWKANMRGKIAHLLSVHVKITAFNVVRQQRSFVLMKLVASVYEMGHDCDVFLDCIDCMIREKHYKEASQCALLLGLQDNFDIYKFLLPLVLQDKLVCVDEFLNESPKHRVQFVSFLDSILGQQCSIRTALEEIIMKQQIPEVKWNKLHNKPWRKLIARFVKMYNLPTDTTPNLNKKRNEGALQFLLHRRYVDNALSDESWSEMAKEAIKDDEHLQQELVTLVAIHGDTAEALKWAHFYNVDRSYWPYAVRMYEENPNEDRHQQKQLAKFNTDSWGEPSPAEIRYHTLNIDKNNIYLVDNVPAFEFFLYTGLQEVDIVGMDCEWKPSFGIHSNELSLLQVATRRAVFILDVMTLGSGLAHLWQKLNERLFSNCDILKLGFSFSGDLSMIRQAIPHLGFIEELGFLDLMSLWKHLNKTSKVTLPCAVDSSSLSLNSLVQQCFGVSLDKSEQFSNWENRPLRDSQLLYAALDAYCLIEIFDVFNECSKKIDYPFHSTCYQLSSSRQTKRKKQKPAKPKKEEREARPQPPSPHKKAVPANSVKVVCDTMLQGLGKSLRRCGVDAAILETKQDHMECVRLAVDEYRYVLTRGATFDKLGGYVPAGHCFKVTTDDIDNQLKQVLEYYKIVVTKDDVFSRCQTCNSNSFIKISNSTMSALANSCSSAKSYPPPCYDDYLADEATGFSSEDDYDDAPPPPSARTRKWDMCSDENVDVGLCQTKTGVKIQVDEVPVPILNTVELFYVCEHCGKVYWDGSHLDKVLAGRLQGIVQ